MAIAILSSFCTAGCNWWGQSPTKPNVVIVLVDTLRADHLGTYGYTRDTSPHIDAFTAKHGIRFEQAFSPSSWTKPATASLLSGVHPLRHRAISRSNAISPDVRLLGEYLREGGYQTAGFVTNPNVISTWGFDRGFDEFVDVAEEVGDDSADAVYSIVSAFLAERAKPPFFLYVHLMDPHTPYDAPAPFDSKWRESGTGPIIPSEAKRHGLAEVVAGYDQEIAFADKYFGELIDDLARREWFEESLVIVTSDHGEEFLDHGGFFHGHSLFNELVHVPLIFKLPGDAMKGSTVDGSVSLLDVVPTVLKYTSVDAAEPLDGIDLTESIRSGRAPADRELVLDLNLLLGKLQFVSEALVRGDWKFIRAVQPFPSTKLFNLASDWSETEPLTAMHPEIAGTMVATLETERANATEGITLWLVGGDDDRPRTMDVILTTDGEFSDARCQHDASAGHVRMATDGKELLIRTIVQSTDNPRAKVPARIVGLDVVEFKVAPENSRVTVSRALTDETPAIVRTGANKSLAEVPFDFDATNPSLSVERKDALFGRNADLSITDAPGIYLTVTRPVEMVIDDATRERLRALGYLGDGE